MDGQLDGIDLSKAQNWPSFSEIFRIQCTYIHTFLPPVFKFQFCEQKITFENKEQYTAM